ncbi:MAG: putative inorganic carbon transporter subunit DabA, partial [Burkholderiales bacterium]
MTANSQVTPLQSRVITEAAELAVRAIPPAWPLAATVAVNPYLGQTGEDLAHVAARLARVSGTPVTMPRAYYRERIASGAITDDDLTAALAAQPPHLRPADVAALKAAAREPGAPLRALPNIASLAADASGTDWPGLINERFGAWAAAYFDEGQALWSAPRAKSAFAAWRAFATQDLTPEIIGLSGFAS